MSLLSSGRVVFCQPFSSWQKLTWALCHDPWPQGSTTENFSATHGQTRGTKGPRAVKQSNLFKTLQGWAPTEMRKTKWRVCLGSAKNSFYCPGGRSFLLFPHWLRTQEGTILHTIYLFLSKDHTWVYLSAQSDGYLFSEYPLFPNDSACIKWTKKQTKQNKI